jgi:hypothetical protein
MANLYGRMKNTQKSNAVDVTRTAGTEIRSQLETWEGAIKTELDRDGNYKVYIGTKSNPTVLIASGNVDHGSFAAIQPDGTPQLVRALDALNGPE